eukprot:6208688-Pleurochrysis_carterae.AAC.4
MQIVRVGRKIPMDLSLQASSLRVSAAGRNLARSETRIGPLLRRGSTRRGRERRGRSGRPYARLTQDLSVHSWAQPLQTRLSCPRMPGEVTVYSHAALDALKSAHQKFMQEQDQKDTFDFHIVPLLEG